MTRNARSLRREWICSIRWIALAVVYAFFGGPAMANGEDGRPDQLEYSASFLEIGSMTPSPESTRFVTLSDHHLHPRIITIREGEHLAWLSYSGAPSTIVFEREVAASIVCHHLVNFSIEDDELKSGEVRAGDVVHFCNLDPGRYRYHIVRDDPATRAKRRLEGVVVVQAMNYTPH